MYIDIHTHLDKEASDEVITIRSVYVKEELNLSPNTNFSYGIHPWYIDQPFDDQLLLLASFLNDMKPWNIALGELGLDSNAQVNLDTQIEVVKQQLELIKSMNRLKVVIVHCVKKYNEMLNIIHKYPEFIYVFHAYNGNEQITKDYLTNPNIYFSFGMRELSRNKIEAILTLIPLNRIFFETDEDINYSIQEVYNKYSSIQNVDIERIKNQIYTNFKKIFN
jgi:TatD DNase family protein